MLTRRQLLAGTASFAAFAASCRRQKASGYPGFAFIANQEGEAIAAVDLTVFAVARHIRVAGRPTAVAVHPKQPLVYALTPENGTIHEIRADTLQLSRKKAIAGSALAMRLSSDGESLFVLCRQPRALLRFSTSEFRLAGQVPLPADPVDFDFDREGKLAAISYGAHPVLSLFETGVWNAGKPMDAGGEIGAVRFLSDSRAILAANRSERMLSMFQVASRQPIVNLPLAVRPDQMCFKADGGELFITGEGMDGVVVVSPFYTPYVSETVLAGHAPGAMATTLSRATNPQFLFVSSPKSGDVSILNIARRQVVAVTTVGTEPGYIAITPDDRYALVLNQGSGDVAVIRIANLTRASSNPDWKRARKGPLFMMIPVGSRPVSAAVMGI